MLWFSGLAVVFLPRENTPLLNSSSGIVTRPFNQMANDSFMALTIGSQAAGQFFSFAPDISKAKQSAIHVNRLMDRVPMIDSRSGKGKHVDHLDRGYLQFKNVHFRYPTRYSPFPRSMPFSLPRFI